MDIQQLRYFNTIVHLENISKAADYLHISQSALSKQIQRLEAELGVPLFDRNGKKISLNKAGMRFYHSSEQILSELGSARDDIDMLVSKKNSHIRIGSAGMPQKMLDCIGSFAADHPEALFILNNRIEFEEQIDINRYDALICPDEFRFEKLNGFHFYDENFLFAVCAKNNLASNNVFHTQFLNDQPLIFMRGESLSPEYPYRICMATDLKPGTLYYSDTRDVHRRMIAANRASGFVPVSESAGYENDPDIRLLPILDKRFSRPMKICFLREKHLSELGLLFRSFVIRYFDLERPEEPSDDRRTIQ